MKIIIISITVAMLLTGRAFSSEYREFTNKDGRSIYARIVEFDSEGESVRLELKNGKKAWVQLSDLSAVDERYIRQYDQEKANADAEELKDTFEPVTVISEEELTAIGEQYVQAWNAGEITKIKVFYLHPENVTQAKLDENKKVIHALNVNRVGDGYIVLSAELTDKFKELFSEVKVPEDAWNQWLLVTGDGTIKYDTGFQKHPVKITLDSMGVLYSRGDKCKKFRDAYYLSNANSERAYEELKDLGVPLFGLDLSRARYQIDKSLIKMTKWLFEEGDKWDATEPKVFFPRELLDTYKESGEYYH